MRPVYVLVKTFIIMNMIAIDYYLNGRHAPCSCAC